MKCQICGCEVSGEIEVSKLDFAEDDAFAIKMDITQRNWICCDACNKIVCYKCATYPAAGYCDSCIESNYLRERLRQLGLIT